MSDLVLTRTFDAPRELVFQAWTERERLQRWWGPKHFTNPVCEVDARTGGKMTIHMRGPDGTIYPMKAEFHEVVPPERIVFTSIPLDPKGEPLFMVLNTVLFEEDGGKTKLTLRAEVTMQTPLAPQYLAGMERGWTTSLERLAEEVGG
jgi:uncharacterized protein YndB with AHSA1/START domain